MPPRKKRANDLGGLRHNRARHRWEATITLASEVVGFDEIEQPDGTIRRKPRYRQKRRTVTGRTQAEAIERLDALRTALAAGPGLPAEVTVGRFLEHWIHEVLPLTDVATTTADGYASIVRLYIVPTVGRRRLDQLSPADVRSMLTRLRDQGLSPNTQRLARAVLRRALRTAESDGLVTRNVAALVDGVRLTKGTGRTLTPEQARTLLMAADTYPYAALVTVLLSLGVRKGEALGLSWSDVNLDGSPATVTIRRGLKIDARGGLYVDEPKTPGSRRTIHLPPPLVEVLRRHRATQAAHRLTFGPGWGGHWAPLDLVFTTSIGTSLNPSKVNREVQAITEAAGLGRWTPHEMRHSAASILIGAGVPLKVISEMLGHSSIRVTADVYGHLLEPARAEAADAMGAVLWG
ncbi:site-specific integrase [soil metagenome]